MFDHPLICVPKPNKNAKIQLFCFPYAGSGASFFKSWSHKLSDKIEICIAAYPGREHRIKEKPILDVKVLLEELSVACIHHINRPFAIFGHSMGGIISYGLARNLEKLNIIPEYLFISACPPPTRHIDKNNALSLLSEDEFIRIIVERYNAIPDIILKDKDLRAIFLPTLRTDISLEEQYVLAFDKDKDMPLDCNIVSFGGQQDSQVSDVALNNWQSLTNRTFFTKIFPGDHFYLTEYQFLLLDTLREILLD